MSDVVDSAVFAAIIQYKIRNDGCTPTVRWIADKCGISSTAAVQKAINNLVANGKLKRGEGKRDLKVTRGRWSYSNGLLTNIQMTISEPATVVFIPVPLEHPHTVLK